jgi:hypothetical protein
VKFLRAKVGKTRRDRIRIIYIRGEFKTEEIQNQIERSRLRWFGHVKRVYEHRIPKILLEMKTSGRRLKGQIMHIWIDQVKRGQDETGGLQMKCTNGQIETAGDAYVKVEPQVWK